MLYNYIKNRLHYVRNWMKRTSSRSFHYFWSKIIVTALLLSHMVTNNDFCLFCDFLTALLVIYLSVDVKIPLFSIFPHSHPLIKYVPNKQNLIKNYFPFQMDYLLLRSSLSTICFVYNKPHHPLCIIITEQFT